MTNHNCILYKLPCEKKCIQNFIQISTPTTTTFKIRWIFDDLPFAPFFGSSISCSTIACSSITSRAIICVSVLYSMIGTKRSNKRIHERNTQGDVEKNVIKFERNENEKEKRNQQPKQHRCQTYDVNYWCETLVVFHSSISI